MYIRVCGRACFFVPPFRRFPFARVFLLFFLFLSLFLFCFFFPFCLETQSGALCAPTLRQQVLLISFIPCCESRLARVRLGSIWSGLFFFLRVAYLRLCLYLECYPIGDNGRERAPLASHEAPSTQRKSDDNAPYAAPHADDDIAIDR